MATLEDYKRLDVLAAGPGLGAGGVAISDNFRKLADRFAFLATTDPGAGDDRNDGFAVGSRWYNTATATEWICTNDAIGAAQWTKAGGNPFDQSLNTTDSPSFSGMMVNGLTHLTAGGLLALHVDDGTLKVTATTIPAIIVESGDFGQCFGVGDNGDVTLIGALTATNEEVTHSIGRFAISGHMMTGGGGCNINLDGGILECGICSAFEIVSGSTVSTPELYLNGTRFFPPVVLRVSSDLTTTAATASSIFSFPIAADEVWAVQICLLIGCNNTGGVRFSITTPSGATLALSAVGNAASVAKHERINSSGTLTGSFNSANHPGGYCNLQGAIANDATAGTVSINFASGTSGQTSTVFANSILIAHRIA
jgi:hypothetical protein